MLFGGGLLAVAALLLLAYCVLEVATTPAADVRGLPKPAWFPVLLLPVVGPVLWLLKGRPAKGAARPSARPPAAPPAPPDDDEVFLRQLRRRAEEQRRAAEEERRRQQGEDGTPA